MQQRKKTQFGIQSQHRVTDTQVIELLSAVDTDSLSEETKRVYEDVMNDVEENVRTRFYHDEYERGEPCPVCDCDELFIFTEVSDKYVATGERNEPIGHNEVHRTTKILCTDCHTILMDIV